MATFICNTTAEFNSALTAANYGDFIVLTAGNTFVGPFTLPDDTGKTGSGWITIQSSLLANLPPGNQNGIGYPIGPSIGPGDAVNMPKLVTTGSNSPVLIAALASHHYKLIGLEVCPSASGYSLSPGDLIELGAGDSTQNTLALCPHDFVVDRCYVHGWPDQNLRRGIRLNSASTDILNCYLSDCHLDGADSQAIGGWDGPGPYNILNCYLEGAGENIMFGGSNPAIANLVPSDILIQNCHFYKQPAWRTYRTAAGFLWQVKNIFEIKNAQRVTLDNNLLEYCWFQGQTGMAISLKATQQGPGAPWSQCNHITVTNNIINHCAIGMVVAGQTNVVDTLTVVNNQWNDLSDANWGGNTGAYGHGLEIQNASNVTFDHNTLDNDGTLILFAAAKTTPQLLLVTNFAFTNNVAPLAGLGIRGSSVASGNASINWYAPSATITGNRFSQALGLASTYPADNTYSGLTLSDPMGSGYSVPAGGPAPLLAGRGTVGNGLPIKGFSRASGMVLNGFPAYPRAAPAQNALAIKSFSHATGLALLGFALIFPTPQATQNGLAVRGFNHSAGLALTGFQHTHIPGAAQSITGVGIPASETEPLGSISLSAGPAQNVIGLSIAASETAPSGGLVKEAAPVQSLTGVGITPIGTTAEGDLAVGPGPAQNLSGVGIPDSEVVGTGSIFFPSSGAFLAGVPIAASEVLAAGNLTQSAPLPQAVTGVGIPAAESMPAGQLLATAGPTQSLVGLGILNPVGPALGALALTPGPEQDLAGVGIAAAEVLASGTLTQTTALDRFLVGVGIPGAEVVAAGRLRRGGQGVHIEYNLEYLGERSYYSAEIEPLTWKLTIMGGLSDPGVPVSSTLVIRDHHGTLLATILPDVDPAPPANSQILAANVPMGAPGVYVAEITVVPADGAERVSDQQVFVVR